MHVDSNLFSQHTKKTENGNKTKKMVGPRVSHFKRFVTDATRAWRPLHRSALLLRRAMLDTGESICSNLKKVLCY